ncbi:MAG: HXXEE domain-containing protein [Lactobacillus sp.]
MKILNSYWLLPLLFMWHDFEELVFVPMWSQHHHFELHGQPLFGGLKRADILAVGIWEEFMIYLFLVILADFCQLPLLIAAAVYPYLFHLLLHLGFSLVSRTYVPGVVTALIELPLASLYALRMRQLTNASLWAWTLALSFMFVFFLGNLKFIHWGMAALVKYTEIK